MAAVTQASLLYLTQVIVWPCSVETDFAENCVTKVCHTCVKSRVNRHYKYFSTLLNTQYTLNTEYNIVILWYENRIKKNFFSINIKRILFSYYLFFQH